MKRMVRLSMGLLLLPFGAALAEPITAGDIKLSGKMQSQCIAMAETALSQMGMKASRGMRPNGEQGPSLFASEKPYYTVVFCENDVAFIAVSGPDKDARADVYRKVAAGIRAGMTSGAAPGPARPPSGAATKSIPPSNGAIPVSSTYPSPSGSPSPSPSASPSPSPSVSPAAYSPSSAADSQRNAVEPNPGKSSDSSELAGMYWCVAPSWSKGTIHLLPNGTYEMNGSAAGHYKAAKGQVHFDGALKDWNNGVARLEGGNLIFEWKTSAGAMQYFAYRK